MHLGALTGMAHSVNRYTRSAPESMPLRTVGRTVFAIVAGYLVNGILVAVTEQFFSSIIPGANTAPPVDYFALDLMSQCLYTVIGGYLCYLIAQASQRAAIVGLMGLGLLVGAVSLVGSWKTEPHWYGIALLVIYSPCVWIGWKLGRLKADRKLNQNR
jgi:peptidoglycan/LPS O-acetylase OafA/YrhL